MRGAKASLFFNARRKGEIMNSPKVTCILTNEMKYEILKDEYTGLLHDHEIMKDIIDDLAHECYTLRQDNIRLIHQMNGRTK